MSDYTWGATPFHYGRWLFIDGTGWAWIPGRVYAPAWVVWRTGYYDEAYIGWGPMPPTWYWRERVAVRVVQPMPARYVFVESRYAFEPSVDAHFVRAERAALVASHTQPFVAPAGGARYEALAQARAPSPVVARVPATALPTKHAQSTAARPAPVSATSRERAVQQQPEAPRPAPVSATPRERAPQTQARTARPAPAANKGKQR